MLRLKNSGYFNIIDKIIRIIKPPKKFAGIPKKILFIRPDRIGDAMVTLPVLRDLKLNYPHIEIHVMASNKNSFVFDGLSFIDKLIFIDENSPVRNLFISITENLGAKESGTIKFRIYKIFLLGEFLDFFFDCFIPLLINKNIKKALRKLKEENYDIAIDLRGRKRIAIISRLISKFTIGSRLFGLSWLYSHYLDTNWVSQEDNDFMTRKIEQSLENSLEIKLIKKDKTLPLIKHSELPKSGKNDIFIHIGTSGLRKLSAADELKLLDSIRGKKVILTDSHLTERFNCYKQKYDFEFKLYENFIESIDDVLQSKLVVCYDGGQAHFLSQFRKTITIFGPGSVNLWRPYEFAEYEVFRKLPSGTLVLKSKGHFGHIVIYRPIWCSPCFDIGCDTRPCLTKLDPTEISALIHNALE